MHKRTSIVYSLARLVILPIYFIFVKTIIEGEHFVPREGRAILVSNHISFIDPICLGYLGYRRKRQVHFLAKDSLFKFKILKWFFTAAGQIPVERGTERAADSLIHARAALENDSVVGIYPESTMPEDLIQLPIKSGALRLSQETGAPIVVVGTWGAHDTWRKGRKPRPRFRSTHAVVVLPPYKIEPEQNIDEAREVLAQKMAEATLKAKRKLGVEK